MITEYEVRDKTIKRFWSKVKFGNQNECWEWQASLNHGGYGQYQIPNGEKWKCIKATRFIYETMFGRFDYSLNVLHYCDNPKCVNPNHLWLGTHKDNSMDREQKGRSNPRKGSEHHNAELTEDHVKLIKIRLSLGETHESIAFAFKVSRATIDYIKVGAAWKHVFIDMPMPTRKGSEKINEDDVREIRKKISNGEPTKCIAETYGISSASIRNIHNHVTWTSVN